MLAAATSFFARTAISQSYNIGSSSNGSRSSTPGPSGSSSSIAPPPLAPPFNIGLWRVQSASHKLTSKRVSVWSFDKRGPEIERLGPLAKERTLEVMKAEVRRFLIESGLLSICLNDRRRRSADCGILPS